MSGFPPRAARTGQRLEGVTLRGLDADAPLQPRGEAVQIALCVVTLKRAWQLKLSMPNNVLVTYGSRRQVTWYIVDANENNAAESHAIEDLVHNGLRLAAKSGHVRLYRAPMRYWHASVGKNTAMMLPLRTSGPRTVCVTVDNDNLLSPKFLQHLLQVAPTLVPGQMPAQTTPTGEVAWTWTMGVPEYVLARWRNPDVPSTTGRSARVPHVATTTPPPPSPALLSAGLSALLP